MADETGMLPIGVFSRLSQITIRMLRHYDERGVLRPARVDPATGYRYYSYEQLRPAARIRALRDIRCPVAMIAELVHTPDQSAFAAGLVQQRQRLLAEREQLLSQLALVDELLHETRKPTMTIDVRDLTLPAMTVAALRDTIATYADEGDLWARLMPAMMAAGAQYDPAGSCGATFYDEGYQECDVDVELWVQVTGPFASTAELRCVDAPERHVIAATLRGPYEGVAAACVELGEWVSAHEVSVAGPMVNVYVVGPAQESDPANWVTEICLPVDQSSPTP